MTTTLCKMANGKLQSAIYIIILTRRGVLARGERWIEWSVISKMVTRRSFEAVSPRKELRMVVSRGTGHALTVLWMGR